MDVLAVVWEFILAWNKGTDSARISIAYNALYGIKGVVHHSIGSIRELAGVHELPSV